MSERLEPVPALPANKAAAKRGEGPPYMLKRGDGTIVNGPDGAPMQFACLDTVQAWLSR